MFYFILIIILLVYVLEAIVMLPLLLLFTIAHASVDDIRVTSSYAFIAGILMDIGSARPLGTSSIFLLIISFLVQLYRHRFREESISFLFASGFIGIHFFSWIFIRNRIFLPLEGILGGIIVIVFVGLLYLRLPRKNNL